jgi:hypothetical protein
MNNLSANRREICLLKTMIDQLKFISVLLTCIIITGSCQKIPQRTFEVPEFESNQSEFSNDELLNATYSAYKIPDNFYHEKLGDTSLYYVNTISIGNVDNNKWIELSTSSADSAREWCLNSSSINSEFAPVVENEKYFEFLRKYNPADKNNIKFRAHKSSYFVRRNYNLLNNSDTIGTFTKLNFSGTSAKELIDYLWYIQNYNNASMKVLSSYFEDSPSETVVCHYGLFTGYGDRSLYDQIKLLKTVYSIDKLTGIIVVNVKEIRTISGNFK